MHIVALLRRSSWMSLDNLWGIWLHWERTSECILLYGKPQIHLFHRLPWITREKALWIISILVRNGSVHRFSLPTVVFPWSRCVRDGSAVLTPLPPQVSHLFPPPHLSQLLTVVFLFFDLAVVVCKILCGLRVMFCHTATLSQMWRM